MTLKTGCFYWMRHKQDPDENQYIFNLQTDPMDVRKMDLSYFDFEILERPVN